MAKLRMPTVFWGADGGTSTLKTVLSYPIKGKYMEDSYKYPTKVTGISKAEFDSGAYTSAIEIDFADFEQTGSLHPNYFAIGNDVEVRGGSDDGRKWRAKYKGNVLTPMLWHGLVASLAKSGVPEGDVQLKSAVCYNANLKQDSVARRLTFPLGLDEGVFYSVTHHSNANGKKTKRTYRFHIDTNPDSGYIFLEETQSAIFLRQLTVLVKNRELADEPFSMIDIGHGTSQCHVVLGKEIKRSEFFDWGIGAIEEDVRQELQNRMSYEALVDTDVLEYMIDVGRLPDKRLYKHTAVLKDVENCMRNLGSRLVHQTLMALSAANWKNIVLTGGGGVQLYSLYAEALETEKRAGNIYGYNLPKLLLKPENNEFGNAFGAIRLLQAHNGIVVRENA